MQDVESDRLSALVNLADEPYRSEAGVIYNLKHGVKGTVSVIESKAGSTRATHYHTNDSHWLFVVSGRVHYSERAVGEHGDGVKEVFEPGQMFYTPPKVEHRLFFPVDTIMVSLSELPRDHESHEKDVVRVKW